MQKDIMLICRTIYITAGMFICCCKFYFMFYANLWVELIGA